MIQIWDALQNIGCLALIALKDFEVRANTQFFFLISSIHYYEGAYLQTT
jgi:hypothetical protein